MFQWSVAGKPMYPGDPSGDLHVVAGDLVAVIDGRGHGPDAAVAAEAVAGVLRGHAGEPIADLLRRCQEKARGTRGAAVVVARFGPHPEWTSVGEVHGVLRTEDGRRESVPAHRGYVGMHLPDRIAVAPLAPGVVALGTDGVDPAFAAALEPGSEAEALHAKFRTKMDDSLLVVISWKSGGGT